MEAKEMGRLIRRAREERGMTREELAAELGVSVFSVMRWENGKTRPLRAFRKQLEEILGVELDKN